MIKLARYKPYEKLTLLPVSTHERHFVGLRDWTAIFEGLTRAQLRLNPCNRASSYEDVTLRSDEQGAQQLAQVLIENLIRYHALPDSIVTNRGSLFTSQF